MRTYSVVRVNDDKSVGTFKTGKAIRVFPEGIDAAVLELVARDAVMTAKTSWVMHPAPEPPKPEPESEIEPPSTRRRWAPA